jgi:hypothetical protein
MSEVTNSPIGLKKTLIIIIPRPRHLNLSAGPPVFIFILTYFFFFDKLKHLIKSFYWSPEGPIAKETYQ